MAMMQAGAEGAAAVRGPLDPRGRVHVPIGMANTVDTLKTFVEAEGPFSPGVATYGIYFWLWDGGAGRLGAPTMDGVACRWGLPETGHLVPWSEFEAGDLVVRTEVCQVERGSPAGKVLVVAARAVLLNRGAADRKVALYAAVRPLGPAGGPVRKLAVSADGTALLVDGRTAVVAGARPSAAGVLASDTVGDLAMKGDVPPDRAAESAEGNCSGALRFDLDLGAGQSRSLGFICPVLAGRRAVRHQWDGTSGWAQLDLAEPNPSEGGIPQPDPGLDYYRRIAADALFKEAEAYWKDLAGRATVRTPDPRWGQAFAAIVGHAALEMNEGAPDVAVVNYNVFNRDGVYVANILQKAGRPDLAAEAIDYFLAHPFNGRVGVEADNPGQVLWIMGQHWLYTRDAAWLKGVYPSAAKLAAMVRYYRADPPPHYVKATSLDFGAALPPDRPDEKPAERKQVLRPGSCDGRHPEYTEAFDVAGLRAAASLARAAGRADDAAAWQTLADDLFKKYDEQFGGRLAAGYGSYSVLWPCRLYGLAGGKAVEQFRKHGARGPGGWRYFPLAAAHQGLLAGNRDAGHGTLARHLDHEQMRGWYVFDEGGRSGSGGWRFCRTTWNPGVAMPHGWAIAELWLLVRDSLVFEDGERLVLLGGVPPAWFTGTEPIILEGLPTWFGPLTFKYAGSGGTARVELSGADPPGGFVLRLPVTPGASVIADGRPAEALEGGGFLLPRGTKGAAITLGGGGPR